MNENSDLQAWHFGEPEFTIHTRKKGASFHKVVNDVKAALAEQGFGVLTEIDVKSTLKNKLGEDVPEYLILGACNPHLAHQALQGSPGIGSLLPCNVVVAKEKDDVFVGAIDPVAMFSVVKGEPVGSLPQEVRSRLEHVIESLSK